MTLSATCRRLTSDENQCDDGVVLRRMRVLQRAGSRLGRDALRRRGPAGQRDSRHCPLLPALRRWANKMYPGYKSTPMDESDETNFGPQMVAFLAEFGARVSVPNDGRDLGPKLAAALY